MSDVCERCSTRGHERHVAAVLTVTFATDETEDGEALLSHEDAFTMPLCMACASDVIRELQDVTRWSSNQPEDPS